MQFLNTIYIKKVHEIIIVTYPTRSQYSLEKPCDISSQCAFEDSAHLLLDSSFLLVQEELHQSLQPVTSRMFLKLNLWLST